MALPDDHRELQVLSGQAVAKLRTGAPVHASILGPEEGVLSFYSGILGATSTGELRLEMPRVVRVVDSRSLDRQPVDEDALLRVYMSMDGEDGDFEVVDLSPRGLSFRVPAQLYNMAKDQKIQLRLKVPRSPSLRLIVRVRNLRRDPWTSGARLVGVQVEIGPRDLAGHVARLLEET